MAENLAGDSNCMALPAYEYSYGGDPPPGFVLGPCKGSVRATTVRGASLSLRDRTFSLCEAHLGFFGQGGRLSDAERVDRSEPGDSQ